MSEELVAAEGGAQVSQVMRVVDTFVAPSKTFTDILRSSNCWLPIVIMVILTMGWAYSIDRTVGFAAATEVQMAKNPKQADAMQQLPPDQRASRMAITTTITKYSTYLSCIFVLIVMLIETLILWASFNFGLGAQTKFGQVFAVVTFAGLPRYLVWVVSSILLFAGAGTENFDMRNPVGTNVGYYLNDSAAWIKAAGQFFDVFGLWCIALLVLGMAIISRKKISQAATVVVGWFVLLMLFFVGLAAVFG
jgi:hypothetical protein